MFCPEEATVSPVPPARKPTAPVIELFEVTPEFAIAPAPEIVIPVPAENPMFVRAVEVELRSDKLLAIKSERPVACLLLKVVQSAGGKSPLLEAEADGKLK